MQAILRTYSIIYVRCLSTCTATLAYMYLLYRASLLQAMNSNLKFSVCLGELSVRCNVLSVSVRSKNGIQNSIKNNNESS